MSMDRTVRTPGTGAAGDTIYDTKGDLAVATGNDAAAKLPAGSPYMVLTPDSSTSTGLKWAYVIDPLFLVCHWAV